MPFAEKERGQTYNAEPESWQDIAARKQEEAKRFRAALQEIADMKPSEIAPEVMPGIVHGPALLFDNCQRIARRALRKP